MGIRIIPVPWQKPAFNSNKGETNFYEIISVFNSLITGHGTSAP